MKIDARRAFTLIELLVVIAIISIIAAILFPTFSKIREKARATACLNNAKQIALADMQYTQDNDETLFSNPENGQGTFWSILLMPYIRSQDVFHCPDEPINKTEFGAYLVVPKYVVTYGMAAPGPHAPVSATAGVDPVPYTLSQLDKPSDIALLTDAVYYWNWTTCEQDPEKAAGVGSFYFGQQDPASPFGGGIVGQPRHQGGNNFVFADGHARWRRVAPLAPNPGDWAGYYAGAKALDIDCSGFSN